MNSKARNVTLYLARIGMMSALSFALMFIKVPYFPPFNFFSFDLANIPVLLTALAINPLSGVLVALIKCLLYFPIDFSKTMGVGIFSNFINSAVYALSAGYIYRLIKGKKGAIIALGSGSLITTALALITNWFAIFPLFKLALGFDVKAAFGAYALYGGVLPVNIINTVLIGVITFFVYKIVAKYIMKGDTIFGIGKPKTSPSAPIEQAENVVTALESE